MGLRVVRERESEKEREREKNERRERMRERAPRTTRGLRLVAGPLTGPVKKFEREGLEGERERERENERTSYSNSACGEA